MRMGKAVSGVDKVLQRRASIPFALQIKQILCVPGLSDQHFCKLTVQESNTLKIIGGGKGEKRKKSRFGTLLDK